MTKLILHIRLKITYRLYLCIHAIQQRLFNKFEKLHEQIKEETKRTIKGDLK